MILKNFFIFNPEYGPKEGQVILATVNSEVFPKVLFSRNFASDAKFRENETLPKWLNHSVIYFCW